MSRTGTPVYYDADGDLSELADRTIAIVGYGNQGRAQALNLRDSGVSDVIVGNREDASWDAAESDGFEVYRIPDAAERADVVFLLIPDEAQPDVYGDLVESHLAPGDVLTFASGYNITYGFIEPPERVDVVLVAPRMIGRVVRELYQDGRGAPALLAVEQDATGGALDVALALAKGIGSTRSGVLETDFETETLIDLMTEQALVPVFLNALLTKYEVERAAGVPPEIILLEQYLSREVAAVFEKAATRGLIEQLTLHSRTSQYGQLRFTEAFDREPLREFMAERLEGIRTGRFAAEWTMEQEAGFPEFRTLLQRYESHDMIRDEQATMDKLGLREE